jgi:hypothetical protein
MIARRLLIRCVLLPLVTGLLTASVSLASVTTFFPTDDAYISNGSIYESYGYSDSLYLNVGETLDDGKYTRTYLKFRIHDVLGQTINSATLYLYVDDVSPDAETVKLYYASDNSDDDWDEHSICWNNKTGYDPYFERTLVVNTADHWETVDATSWAWDTQYYDPSGYLTVVIKSSVEGDTDRWCRFLSAETQWQASLDIDWSVPEEPEGPYFPALSPWGILILTVLLALMTILISRRHREGAGV